MQSWLKGSIECAGTDSISLYVQEYYTSYPYVLHIYSLCVSLFHPRHTAKCFGASAIQPSVYRCGNPFV